MKKIISLLLTMCIMLSFGINYVTAETTTPPADNTDTLPDVEQEPLTGEGDNNAAGPIDINATTTSLLYSTVYYWDAATMPNYNCYAYALGKTDDIYEPGDFSNQTYDTNVCNINKVANLVEDDLRDGLGYKCVKRQTNRPNTATSGATTIAVRQTTKAASNGGYDFHFAKLINGRWHHKPGKTAILIFKNYPSNDVAWTNESYSYNTYRTKTLDYDSDIIYFIFSNKHCATTAKYTGNNYHKNGLHYFEYDNICNNCGVVTGTTWSKQACSGPPCALPSGVIQTPELY